jgi:hypothetical protein
MQMNIKDEILNQIGGLITTGRQLISSFKPGDMGTRYSDEPEEHFRAFVTGALAAISQIAGEKSDYYRTIPRDKLSGSLANPGYDTSFIPSVLGALQSLHNAVDKGYLTSLESRLRANVHDDFLAQASELLNAGYHVAAMVLAGGVLENHLHKLVTARGLSWSGSGSLSKYNDILKDTVYPQTTWRRIQSISDVRNDAAHGNTGAVKVEDVRDALYYIPRILTDYPS